MKSDRATDLVTAWTSDVQINELDLSKFGTDLRKLTTEILISPATYCASIGEIIAPKSVSNEISDDIRRAIYCKLFKMAAEKDFVEGDSRYAELAGEIKLQTGLDLRSKQITSMKAWITMAIKAAYFQKYNNVEVVPDLDRKAIIITIDHILNKTEIKQGVLSEVSCDAINEISQAIIEDRGLK
jgi:hypothetical protein